MGDTVRIVRTLGGLRGTVRELADAALDQRGEYGGYTQPGSKARGHFHDGQMLAFRQALELIEELHPAYRYATQLMALVEEMVETRWSKDSDLNRRATALLARIRAEEAEAEDVESHVIEALLHEGHSIASVGESIAELRKWGDEVQRAAQRVVDRG